MGMARDGTMVSWRKLRTLHGPWSYGPLLRHGPWARSSLLPDGEGWVTLLAPEVFELPWKLKTLSR